MACFGDTKTAWSVVDVLTDGDKKEAISLLKAAKEMSIARERQASATISYLEGNIDHIAMGAISWHDGVRQSAPLWLSHGLRTLRVVDPRWLGYGAHDIKV